MLHKCLFTCHLEVYPRDELASLLPNRSSFDFIHLWRLLLETSLSSPTYNSGAGHQRIRRGLKAGTVCQSYTPLHPSWDGANIHQARRPEPRGPGCLDSIFPHHLLWSRRLQLYKHYLCFSAIIFRNKCYFNKVATFHLPWAWPSFLQLHEGLSSDPSRQFSLQRRTLQGSASKLLDQKATGLQLQPRPVLSHAQPARRVKDCWFLFVCFNKGVFKQTWQHSKHLRDDTQRPVWYQGSLFSNLRNRLWTSVLLQKESPRDSSLPENSPGALGPLRGWTEWTPYHLWINTLLPPPLPP